MKKFVVLLLVGVLVGATLGFVLPGSRALFQKLTDEATTQWDAVKRAGRKALKGEQAESGKASVPEGTDGRQWVEPLTGMPFVWVPGGCFRMGSDEGEKGRERDEGPLHDVCIDGFWMGRREVTQGEFRRFVEASGYVTDAEREGFSWIYTGAWEKRGGYSWRRPGFFQDESHPVVHVSLNDARAMAQWLGEKTGGSFGLPTEAQWEYACRAGRLDARFWGEDPQEACRWANAADATAAKDFPSWTVHGCSDGYVFTAPVGSFGPNGFGLQDMLGNVWEWCADGYDPQAYRKHASKNPAVVDPSQATRVIRGGSWYSRPEHVRCAKRDALTRPDRRSQDLGFRLIRQ